MAPGGYGTLLSGLSVFGGYLCTRNAQPTIGPSIPATLVGYLSSVYYTANAWRTSCRAQPPLRDRYDGAAAFPTPISTHSMSKAGSALRPQTVPPTGGTSEKDHHRPDGSCAARDGAAAFAAANTYHASIWFSPGKAAAPKKPVPNGMVQNLSARPVAPNKRAAPLTDIKTTIYGLKSTVTKKDPEVHDVQPMAPRTTPPAKALVAAAASTHCSAVLTLTSSGHPVQPVPARLERGPASCGSSSSPTRASTAAVCPPARRRPTPARQAGGQEPGRRRSAAPSSPRRSPITPASTVADPGDLTTTARPSRPRSAARPVSARTR